MADETVMATHLAPNESRLDHKGRRPSVKTTQTRHSKFRIIPTTTFFSASDVRS
ncbi:MAG: hypothetical protein JW749_09105 [Sedimentisphaerales bacterium]|nr:hypothetical protein [Sedimentisphaerales bacterium]